MLSLTNDVHQLGKTRKMKRGRKKTGFSLGIHKFLFLKSMANEGLKSCPEFMDHRATFIEKMRDELQFSEVFDQAMVKEVSTIIKEIIISSGDSSPVVDSDQNESSSSSTGSDSGKGLGEEQSNGGSSDVPVITTSYQVNFAFQVKKILDTKFMKLNEKSSCLYAAKLVVAAKMSEEDVKELKLDKIISYLQHGSIF